MFKCLKNYKKLYIVIGVIILILLVYFFWPLSFKANNMEQISITIVKVINGTRDYYELNEQEVSDFAKILEKSKFYRGTTTPERMFRDKCVTALVCGGISPNITIYYDTDKTYVFATISTSIFKNMDYRISNKDEINDYIEQTVNTEISEFKEFPKSVVVSNNTNNNMETNGSLNKQSNSEQRLTSIPDQSTSGSIYDRNGVLLATNKLSYSVVMKDTAILDDDYNDIIYKLIKIIEDNGDSLYNEFYISQNELGELEFTVEGSSLTQFKKNAFAYILKDGNLTEEQLNATAESVYEFLRMGTGNGDNHMFNIPDKYSIEDTLKIMSVRYALFCNFPKNHQIIVASKVSDDTVTAVMESNADLQGVEIQQQTSQ